MKNLGLNDISDASTFRQKYFLKAELVEFCRRLGLPCSGSKCELTERIAYYVETGKKLTASSTVQKRVGICPINENARIEPNFVCSEKHRAFFAAKIGSQFSFTVAFQKWLKENAGKTYADAIGAYHRIISERKRSKPPIGKQFEYNTYIRDFFADNHGKCLQDAIQCWHYKKQATGSHAYERADLIALQHLQENGKEKP